MVGCSKKARSIIVTTDASLRRHYPYRFKGYLSPRRIDDEDPYAIKQITVNGMGKQACVISNMKMIVSGDIVKATLNKSVRVELAETHLLKINNLQIASTGLA